MLLIHALLTMLWLFEAFSNIADIFIGNCGCRSDKGFYARHMTHRNVRNDYFLIFTFQSLL